jgi:hypothetical protein
MEYTIEGIPINAENVVNAIKYYYPKTFDIVEKNALYEYVFLFGIRVYTCDTGLPDDYLGALRYMPNYFDGSAHWEIIVTDGTTDPSPTFLRPGVYFDDEAKLKKGAAWVKEGQYFYAYAGYKSSYPAYAPVLWTDSYGRTRGIPVYRWIPKYDGEKFDKSKAIPYDPNHPDYSESTSCMIHRHWRERYTTDSAGCQVFNNNELLWTLKKWTDAHNRNSRYPKKYLYTLLDRQQFITGSSKSSSIDWSSNPAWIFHSPFGSTP